MRFAGSCEFEEHILFIAESRDTEGKIEIKDKSVLMDHIRFLVPLVSLWLILLAKTIKPILARSAARRKKFAAEAVSPRNDRHR